MKYILCVIVCLLLLIPTAAAPKQKDNYEKFIDDAMKYFQSSSARINKEYDLGNHERWDANQDTGKLIFSDKGVPKVIADVVFAGSYSTYSGTWKWAWANKSVNDSMKKDVARLRDYGDKNNFKELTTPVWECSEEYAWVMTAAAGYFLKAKAAYKGPIDEGYGYMLIMDIKWADGKE